MKNVDDKLKNMIMASPSIETSEIQLAPKYKNREQKRFLEKQVRIKAKKRKRLSMDFDYKEAGIKEPIFT